CGHRADSDVGAIAAVNRDGPGEAAGRRRRAEMHFDVAERANRELALRRVQIASRQAEAEAPLERIGGAARQNRHARRYDRVARDGVYATIAAIERCDARVDAQLCACRARSIGQDAIEET